MLRFGLWAAIALLAAAAPARAQDAAEEAPPEGDGDVPRDEREEEARSLFRAAESALADGRYENALDYFTRAYELSGYPELLFNIGIASDHLHRSAQALESFEAYLEARPDAENREEVEIRVVELRDIVGEQNAAQEETSAPTVTSDGPGLLPLTLTVSGGVVMVTGAILLGYALAEKSSLESATPDNPGGDDWAQLSGRHDLVPIMSTVGIIALGVGAAALTTGLIWLFTGDAGSAEQAPVTAVVGPGYLGVRGRL